MNNFKTLFFGALIAAMILPFSSMGVAEAQEAPTKYTKQQIDRSFRIAQEHVTYQEETNHMILNVESMREHGATNLDIRIAQDFASIHDRSMDAFFSGNSDRLQEIDRLLRTGSFSSLFEIQVKKSHQRTDLLSLTACGITLGQSHPEPPVKLALNGYKNQASINKKILSQQYHEVPRPYVGAGFEGRDFGKINTTGIGGCTGGEFRDQQVVYSGERTIRSDNLEIPPTGYRGSTFTTSGWYTLQQINEPNPELNRYVAPTLWWDAYVAVWHVLN